MIPDFFPIIKMITNDNLSLEKLHTVLKTIDSYKVERSSDFMLTLTVEGDNKCFISAIGSLKILFFKPSPLDLNSCSVLERLTLVNVLNSDLSNMSTAYLDEDNELAFKHSISVSGGIDESNLLMVAMEFQMECVIFDQIIKSRIKGKAE